MSRGCLTAGLWREPREAEAESRLSSKGHLKITVSLLTAARLGGAQGSSILSLHREANHCRKNVGDCIALLFSPFVCVVAFKKAPLNL